MIREYLKQPYPLHANKWRLILFISIFVGLFMLVFQPFGLSQVTGEFRYLFCFGYGAVTMIMMIVDMIVIQYLFRKQFDYKQWTVQKQLIWLCWIIFSVGLGNFIYTSVFSMHWNWEEFFYFQLVTLAVGLIPILVLTIINQNRRLAENLKLAKEFNNNLKNKYKAAGNDLVALVAENEKDSLQLELSSLLYIESTGNYIDINYLKDGVLKNTLLRSTLKRSEQQLEKFNSVLKCHRAFLVNVSCIAEVKGNSQGLRLALKHTETEIPVSLNFSKSLKEKLNSLR
jgi:hypothetical protein